MKHVLITIAAVVLVGTAFAAPIHSAASNNDLAGVHAELGKGVDVDEGDDSWPGMTPLHYAADEGHTEVVELLIGAGADVNAKVVSGAAQGKTPLYAANETNHPKTADLIRKHQLMPRLVQHGRFAFSFDAKEGKVYEVQDSFNLLNWEVIKTYTGTGATVRFDEERDHDPLKIFYRVKLVE